MKTSRILRARELKRNEALNKIRKIYNPKYNFPYDQGDPFDDYDNSPNPSEQREKYIMRIIEQLESDLSTLKVTKTEV